MKHINKILFSFLAILSLSTTLLPVSTASAAYNYAPVCNTSSSWKIANSASTNAGVLRVYKNGTSICAVHYNTTGQRLYIGVVITKSGKEAAHDYGKFLYYAGPVRTTLPAGQCAKINGYGIVAFKPDGTPGIGWGKDIYACQ